MLFSISLLLLIYNSATINEPVRKNTLQQMELNGNVKSIIENHYLYGHNGDTPKFSKWSSGYDYYYQFDTAGFVLEQGKCASIGKCKKYTKYIYDQSKRKISEDYYNDGHLQWQTIFKYDKNGFPIQEIEYEINPQDLNNNKIYYTKNFTCDSTGNIILTNYTNSKGEFWKEYYKYDKGNYMIEKTKLNQNGDTINTSHYQYDFTGKVIDKNIKNIIYTYDPQGNWITKLSGDPNSNRDLIERTITYY